jgi:hypothetical protein
MSPRALTHPPDDARMWRRLSDADKLFAAPTPSDFAPAVGMRI